MTATIPAQSADTELTAHQIVDRPIPTRRRITGGAVMVIAGVVTILAWGIGARNGDAAFEISFITDRWHVPDLRYPGGGVAMVMGAIIVALGLYHMARGFSRRRMRWVSFAAIVLFILAFLSWAATGNPEFPLSLPSLVSNSVVAAIPFVLGALAGIVCERSGVINIAIEGQMLLGAFAGAMFASTAKSAGIGIVAAMIGGALIAVLLAVFAIRYLVNQVVLGVVLNTFALGLTNLGYQSFMQNNPARFNNPVTLSPIKIPLLGDIPIIGPAFFDVNLLVYITYGLVVLVDVGLFRTRWGLRTRAVGEHPKAADTVGIKVLRTRYRNVLIGGLIAGLAGAFLTVGGSGAFNSNISSGKGFIALAAVIFGRWSPRGAIAAALLFGFTDQLQISLGIVGTPVQIPQPFFAMLPYVATVIAVAGLVGRVRAPAADGEPYTKG
jgi:simple sugar transport system permease protein